VQKIRQVYCLGHYVHKRRSQSGTEMSGISYFWLHSYSDKFNSESFSNIIFRLQTWGNHCVTSKSQFTLALIFGFDFEIWY